MSIPSRRFPLAALLLLAAACSSSPGTDSGPNGEPDAGPDPLECDAGETPCDEQCVDLMSSGANCGVCGRICDAELVCDEGQCMTPEAACELEGQSDPTSSAALCDGECVDLQRDVNHCGTCGGGCPVGDACVMGFCQGPPAVESCAAQVKGTLRTGIADIALDDARAVTAGLQHAYDVDDVEAQGCLDHFELQADLGSPGCTLKLIFASDEAGTGLVYASLDVDSFCPGFSDAEEGVYERTDGWAPTWFGLAQIDDAIASETCVAGEWLSFDDTPLRLLRGDGAELLVDLSAMSLAGWIPSEQNTAGACVPGPTCGEAHDGGDGWCVLAGCSSGFHDGGDQTCVSRSECTPGYVMRGGDCAFIHTETAYSVEFEKIAGTSLALDGPCRSTGECTAHISYLSNRSQSCSLRTVGHATESGDEWDWQRIDLTRSSYSEPMKDRSTVVDSNGDVHVCYLDWAPDCTDPDPGLIYATLSGGQWSGEAIAADIGGGDPSCALALDAQNHPHIAYAGSGSAAHLSRLNHVHRTSEGWTTEVIDDDLRGLRDIAIVVDSAQRAHAAYYYEYYGDMGVEFGVRYARQLFEGGSGAAPSLWEVEHVDTRSRAPSLAVDSDGRAHISYYDYFEEYLKYAYGTVGDWRFDVLDPGQFAGFTSSIALDANDTPHVAYPRSSLGGGLILSYRTSDADQPFEWDKLTVDGRTTQLGSYPSLAMDADGNAHVSYTDGTSLADPYGHDLLLYSIVGSARPCPPGNHDGGNGACVPNYTCFDGFWDGGAGPCVPEGECSHGFHDGGDGSVCVPLDECLPGYHDGGAQLCLPIGECRLRYRDGGDGICLRDNLPCSQGFHDRGDGVCAPVDECLPGFISEGADDCTRALTSTVYEVGVRMVAVAVDASDAPHIAYQSFSNALNVFASKNADGDWTTLGVGRAPDNGNLQSMLLDPQQNLHLGYSSYLAGTGSVLRYASTNVDAGDWDTSVIEPGAAWGSITVDSLNNPRAAYRDASDTVWYAQLTNGVWTRAEIPGPSAGGWVQSLKLGSNDAPYVLYHLNGGIGIEYVHLEAGVWKSETGLETTSSSVSEFWAGSDGVVRVGFIDDQKLRYATRGSVAGAAWNVTTLEEERTDAMALALDAANRPHLAYVVYKPGEARAWRLMYAVHDGDEWVIVEILSSGTRLAAPLDIVVDSVGHAHVAFQLGSSDGLLQYSFVQKQL